MKTIILNDDNLRVSLDPLGVKVETLLTAGAEEKITIQVLNLTWTQFDILKNLPWCALEGVVRPNQAQRDLSRAVGAIQGLRLRQETQGLGSVSPLGFSDVPYNDGIEVG